MGLISRKERANLIEILLKLPNKEKYSVRTNLLAYIPADVKNNIERDGAPKVDFQNILSRVDEEEWEQPPTSGWPLLTLLENAIDHAGGTSRVGESIKEIHSMVSKRAATWSQLPRTTAPELPEGLERQIQEMGGFLDSTGLRQRERAVCRVEFEGNTKQAIGTGFLLGPSVAITNYHVMQDVILGNVSPNSVILRFDCVGPENNPSPGQEYRLAKDWLIEKSPPSKLDFALLQIDSSPGSAPSSNEPNGPIRGYLTPISHDFLIGEPLVIIQHPKGSPRRFAVDRVKRVQSNHMRVGYVTDTDYGSSGSPCFTVSFTLVALHQGFFNTTEDIDQPNKGIPFTKILELPKVRSSLGK